MFPAASIMSAKDLLETRSQHTPLLGLILTDFPF